MWSRHRRSAESAVGGVTGRVTGANIHARGRDVWFKYVWSVIGARTAAAKTGQAVRAANRTGRERRAIDRWGIAYRGTTGAGVACRDLNKNPSCLGIVHDCLQLGSRDTTFARRTTP